MHGSIILHNKVFPLPSLPVFMGITLMIVDFLQVNKDCSHGNHYAAHDAFSEGVLSKLNNNTKTIKFKMYSDLNFHISPAFG